MFVFPVILIFIVGFISWSNYTPGTYLSGWDTLHPEFNFALYLKRIFWGVWQEHQGLGALSVQSQAGEFGHLLLTWALSLFLPQNMVRYVFFILTLVFASLGSYFFILKGVLYGKENFSSKLASFIGALFYLLNLGTIQQYYVPLEMFAVHFATLPWLFLLVINFLRTGGKKNLLWFFVVNLFAASSSHTPTLFYVYLALLALYLFFWLLVNFKLKTIKRILVILGITALLNFFWMAPNIYYLMGHSGEVQQSKIHSDFTPEAFLQSKSYGTFNDLVYLKNFLFNWRQFDFSKNTYEDLMSVWSDHLGQKGIREINYTLIGLAIFGFMVAIFKKNKVIICLFPLAAVCVFFLINSNPPFESVFELLRNKLPLLKEGLRFPFTKFSFAYTFCLSSTIGFILAWIIEKLRFLVIKIPVGLVVISAVVYLSFPIFKGFLFDPAMKIKLPNEYFEVFEWFRQKDPSARIAKLPLNTFWGWNFYSWGYQGAGFSWFGLEQPILEREFDRWGPYNESFYNEVSYILYKYNALDTQNEEGKTAQKIKKAVEEENAKTVAEFEKVLAKYRVKYLLLDESVINAGGSSKLLFIPQIKELIANSETIKEEVKFGFITVYSVATPFNTVWAPESFVAVDVDTIYSKYDFVYHDFKDYITFPSTDNQEITPSTGYPFVNFDKRSAVSISVSADQLIIENNTQKAKAIFPVKDRLSEDFSLKRGFEKAYNCDLKKIGAVTKENLGDRIIYKADRGGVSCDYFYYPEMSGNRAWIMHIKGENLKGRSLKVYLQNLVTSRMDLEELLPEGNFDAYYVVFPSQITSELISTENSGYTLNVETRSFGKVGSENVIEVIEFIPFDIDYLTSLTSSGEAPQKIENNLQISSVKKWGTSAYSLKPQSGTSGNRGLIALGQGYDEGWKAFTVDSQNRSLKKLTHVKVNGWANGWLVEAGQDLPVVIVYWPQILQWLGLALVPLILMVILLTNL